MANPGGDVYEETIDYIKQIEREIECSFETNSLEQLRSVGTVDKSSSPSKSNKHGLVDRFARELKFNSGTSSTSAAAATQPRKHKSPTFECTPKPSLCSTPSPHPPQDESLADSTKASKAHHGGSVLAVDKESNYRYSFYDNSNQISIFLAHSSLISATKQSNEPKVSGPAESDKVFGCNPSTVQRRYHGLIAPPFFEEALFYLSKFGLNSVGIFRKSGVKSRINSMRDQIEQCGGQVIDFASVCVFDVADLVKSWLRELRPHLITKEMVASFAASTKSTKTSEERKFSLIALDDSHRYLLWVVLKFLSQIASCCASNQMTVQNIAICFAPSLCECETEAQIVAAQKCLEHCIREHESLFCITLSPALCNIPVELNRHEARVVVSASPRDILNRILYERNVLDPLISELSLKSETKNADTIEMSYKFSFLLPQKTFLLRRTWSMEPKHNSISLNELADLYKSSWRLQVKGQGQTLVTHLIDLDFRGFSRNWYECVYSLMHQRQLYRLAESFQMSSSSSSTLSSSGNASSSTNQMLVSDL